MTKSELIAAINTKLPEMEFQNIELAVNCMLTHMTNVLEEGERIEVRGFGSFDLHHHSPRLTRNPRTGESLRLIAKKSFILKRVSKCLIESMQLMVSAILSSKLLEAN